MIQLSLLIALLLFVCVLGGQVIENGEVDVDKRYDIKFGTEIYIYNLNYAVGETSLGFRVRHGYGVSALMTFHITCGETESVVEFRSREENADEWYEVSGNGDAITDAYVAISGIPPTSLPSLHIIEYTHIEMIFGFVNSPPKVLFPSGEPVNEITSGDSLCSLTFTFTKPLYSGTYEVYYTEDPFLIVSSPFGPRTEGRLIGSVEAKAGDGTSGDTDSITIYNALTTDIDQPYWFGIYLVTDDGEEARAISSNECLRDEQCPFQGVEPSLEYADPVYYCDCDDSEIEKTDDTVAIVILSCILTATCVAIGWFLYQTRYNVNSYRPL